MGYTQYWHTKPSITKEKWDKFTAATKILLDKAKIIQYESDTKQPPAINDKMVRFNGIGDKGHETFVLFREDTPKDWAEDKSKVFGFCKTARKPYDVYVTASLLLARIILGDEIEISSDGDVIDWQEGVKLLNDKLRMGVNLSENLDAEYPGSMETAILTNTEDFMEISIVPENF